ncbi:MAG: biotin-dependent carboxyltransferase family protein [Spirochaetales bacterium]|jgi:biotin-dependent carboxylase-like uncharacterized protein|nr:biotin-dependent carboxyltransferase family protein [Spirochaetales bacterium]
MGQIVITDPGMKAFVEDLGRYGYQRYGVSVSGAVDELAARTANFLVGNQAAEALIEITLKGLSLEFKTDTLFAITGSPCEYTLNGEPLPLWASRYAAAGDLLAGGFMTGGLRNYLAIAGGIDVPLIMGSRSTNLRGKFGGYKGRELKKGDILETGNTAAEKTPRPRRALKACCIPRYGTDIDLRVISGPQDEALTEAGMRTFLSSPYKVSFDSDRMGIRLAGEKIEHVKAADIISDGIAFGSVQAPGDGQPIIMLAERQTTGGYCKIATVITADRSRLAQARPKCLICFHKVSMEEALEALKEYRSFFDKLDEYCPVENQANL